MSSDLDRILADAAAPTPSPQFTARVMGAVRREAARADARTSAWASLWPALAGTAAVTPLVVLVDAMELPAARGVTEPAVWLGLALIALLVALPAASPAPGR